MIELEPMNTNLTEIRINELGQQQQMNQIQRLKGSQALQSLIASMNDK